MAIAVGVRVVRGPDWKWNDQDDGEGHVGTVVEVGKSGIKNVVVVQWDAGTRMDYRAGYQERYDLLVFDNSTVGIHHASVTCDACNTENIYGIRWKCKECHDYDLCSQCYMNDKHDVTHKFLRFGESSSTGVEVSPRSQAVPVKSRGVFVNAKVVRGTDWEWGNLDGHENVGIFSRLAKPTNRADVGLVLGISGWNAESRNNGVRVSWQTGKDNLCRLGYNGKVDLKYVSDAPGDLYYQDHLPILGFEHDNNNSYAALSMLRNDDKVKLCVSAEDMKILQVGHGEWNSQIAMCIEKIGTIQSVRSSGDIEVKFDGFSFPWTLNPQTLTKITIATEKAAGGLLGTMYRYCFEKLKFGLVCNICLNSVPQPSSKREEDCNTMQVTTNIPPCNNLISYQENGTLNEKHTESCTTCQQVIMDRITNGHVLIQKPSEANATRMKLLENKIEQLEETQNCSICLDNRRNIVFLCGHSACSDCAERLSMCHICRKVIEKKIVLY